MGEGGPGTVVGVDELPELGGLELGFELGFELGLELGPGLELDGLLLGPGVEEGLLIP